MDWLVDKAIAIGKKIMGALGLGEKEEEDDPKWKAGVAGVQADLEKMQNDGLSEEAVQGHVPAWKGTYGFSELEVKLQGDEFDIFGSMSPKRKFVAKATGDNPTEGLPGTFSGLQGTKGDKMTPDHEPQHALLAYVSDLTTGRFQGFRKPFEGTPVEKYSKGEGICLNMFQGRHVQTRTYGVSPRGAIGKISSSLSALPVDAPVTTVRKTVKDVVDAELSADQGVVAGIYQNAKVPPAMKSRVTKGLGQVTSMNSKWW